MVKSIRHQDLIAKNIEIIFKNGEVLRYSHVVDFKINLSGQLKITAERDVGGVRGNVVDEHSIDDLLRFYVTFHDEKPRIAIRGKNDRQTD